MSQKRMSVWLDSETVSRLKIRAGSEGKSMSECVRDLVVNELDSRPGFDMNSDIEEVISRLKNALESRSIPVTQAHEIDPSLVRFLVEKLLLIVNVLEQISSQKPGVDGAFVVRHAEGKMKPEVEKTIRELIKKEA